MSGLSESSVKAGCGGRLGGGRIPLGMPLTRSDISGSLHTIPVAQPLSVPRGVYDRDADQIPRPTGNRVARARPTRPASESSPRFLRAPLPVLRPSAARHAL